MEAIWQAGREAHLSGTLESLQLLTRFRRENLYNTQNDMTARLMM